MRATQDSPLRAIKEDSYTTGVFFIAIKFTKDIFLANLPFVEKML